ncbi:protein-export chaperone SecB [Enterovirga rhinocerotis]|uniref:Protein-export protein SecB n=1 Tax=Enterovirga rhinocerotis TaxID=1339210 RepID=A0A4R7BT43_9HYPH|nr:protein-export chaperone SecB [Enterovirga rhinocerotis]TDR87176.1 protein translocase subunit secB [Enterovirga rhinocerotis]
MAENPAANGAQPNPEAPGNDAQLNALAQYAKDISFENPNAPRSLQPQTEPPQIGIQVNVNAKQLSETDFEVDLTLEGSAKIGNDTLFAFDLTYSGVFRAVNIAPETLHFVIMVECPRLLFPFARQIVADLVRNGGFPPLYIDPIDFIALYRQKAAENAGQGLAPAAPLAN